jgi:hypothetical protein
MRDWLKIIVYLIFIVVVFGGIGWYTVHTWSDCLEENSVLTCARMLYK